MTRSLVAAWALLLAAAPCLAGSFSVAPVLVSLDGRSPSSAVRVTNTGPGELKIQSELLRWTQSAGQDVYEPTDELLVNPPIFTVAPGATQMVRLGATALPRCPVECSYRLLLSELPKTGAPGLTVALRISVPVFVAPLTPSPARLTWQARRTESGTLLVSARNEGAVRVQILAIAAAGTPGARRNTPRYVLGGRTATWEIAPPVGPPSPSLELDVVAADGRSHVSVRIEER